MADTTTTNLGLTKPTVNVEDPVTDWGVKNNGNFDLIDAILNATSPAAQVIGAGATGTSMKAARADHVHPMAFSSDLPITGAGKGIVVTTPDGAHTYRIAISNTGELTTEQIT